MQLQQQLTRRRRSLLLGLMAMMVAGSGVDAADYQPSCKAAEPVMLSLMVEAADYCPGLRLTKDGVAAFTDVWNRGEHIYGALFMSRCITQNVTEQGWSFDKGPKFHIPKFACDSTIDLLEGWRASMTKKRGPLAERLP